MSETTSQPAPKPNGKCSRDCPLFYLETMRGWPTAQACYAWDKDLDGEEPLYLTDHICKPAIRLVKASAPGAFKPCVACAWPKSCT